MAANNTINIHLKTVPGDVNYIIKREQSRIDFFEQQKITQEFVVYQIIREWYKFKNLFNEKSLENDQIGNYNDCSE